MCQPAAPTQVLSFLVKFLMIMLMSSYDQRVESRIGVVMRRLISGTHQQDHKNFTKKLKTCVDAGGGYIKNKFLKHYQVSLLTVF